MRRAVLAAATVVGLAAAASLVRPHTARADDTSLGRFGECVRPIKNGQVEMVEEDIDVRVTPRKSFVTCRFVFRNTGPATGVLMGFPEQQPDPDREMGDDVGIHDFRAWVKGVELPVKREKGVDPTGGIGPLGAAPAGSAEYPFWWTWNVSFGAGETIEVRNSYWVRHTFVSNGEIRAGYILTTGEAWKGPIGTANITFRLDGPKPFQVVRAFPGNYRFSGDDMVWEWRDFEPGANIEMVFSVRPGFFGKGETITGAPAPGPTAGGPNEAENLYWKALNAAMNWDYETALTHAKRLAALPGLSPEGRAEAQAFEAQCRFITGDKSWGRQIWEKRLESGQATAEDYYFLGSIYAASGEKDRLAALYRRLCDIVPPGKPVSWSEGDKVTVRRWLASRVPGEARGEFSSGEHAPVLTKVVVSAENPSLPASLTLRATVDDEDDDLSWISVRVWHVEGGEEKVLFDDSPLPLSGRFGSSTAVGFTPPWPFATVYYRVTAEDAAGHTLETGPFEFTIDKVKDWMWLDVPGPRGAANSLVQFRYHGDTGKRIATGAAKEMARALDALAARLEVRPCNRVIVSLYERSLDEPEKGLAGAFPDYPWYVVEGDRAPDAGRVVADVLSRVLAHNLGPAWYTKPGAGVPWQVKGLADFLRDVDSKEARMVKALYDRGVPEFARFLRRLGDMPEGPDKALQEMYSITVADLERQSRKTAGYGILWAGFCCAALVAAVVLSLYSRAKRRESMPPAPPAGR